MKTIYLDNHSTTQPLPAISIKTSQIMNRYFGNASSNHPEGTRAEELVEDARSKVSDLFECKPEQIYFTNSATEANNIIIKGRWEKERLNGNKDLLNIIITPIEHRSVLASVEKITMLDPMTQIHYIKIKSDGNIDYYDLASKLKLENILLVSIMTANNEIGTINDICKIKKMCNHVFFHTDATQAVGKTNVVSEGIGAISFSGHKIHGPKGVGAFFLDNPDKLSPIIDGGYQNTFSSGTINVPAVFGMGRACEYICSSDLSLDNAHIERLRDMLLGGIMSRVDGVNINGTVENRLINNINISIDGVPAEAFMNLPDICISSGSACSSGFFEPSYVIRAIGAKIPENTIRFGLSKFNTEEEIKYTIERIVEVVKSIRNP